MFAMNAQFIRMEVTTDKRGIMGIKVGNYVCTQCGFVGTPKISSSESSCLLEIFLFLLFIIPWLIYALFVKGGTGTPVCPDCRSPAIVPADSPMGQKLLYELYPVEKKE